MERGQLGRGRPRLVPPGRHDRGARRSARGRPATLEGSITRYNAACEHGHDEQFGRDPATLTPVVEPPFYGFTWAPMLAWSNGGPRRDERAQVLDVAGEVIPGLYAAGNISSTYSWCKDGGFHIADALVFGRVAGREAATRR